MAHFFFLSRQTFGFDYIKQIFSLCSKYYISRSLSLKPTSIRYVWPSNSNLYNMLVPAHFYFIKLKKNIWLARKTDIELRHQKPQRIRRVGVCVCGA